MTFSPTTSTLADRATTLIDRATTLIDVARTLANERGDAAFTVADVVQRAGVSLKAFYATVGGKDELLLALLAADSHLGAQLVSTAVDRFDDPQDRLHAWIFELCSLAGLHDAIGYAGLLARETRRLGDERPAELAGALAPLLDGLAAVLDEIGSRDTERDVRAVFSLVIDAIHDITRGRADPIDAADYLTGFVLRAVAGALPGGDRE